MNESKLKELGFVKLPNGEWAKPSAIKVGGNNGRQLSVVQKQQEVDTGQANGPSKNPDASKNEKENESFGGTYYVRFVFLVSDHRRRDGFGMSETVADCLVRALRRFAENSL